MLPERLQPFADKPTPVLNDGHVLLVDVLGDEQAIVDAARVSYGAGTKRVSEDRHLIRYLMRHSHTTPFEMCEIVIRVRVPMDCWRQWIRHRTASVNEYSTRYSEAIDSRQKTEPDAWRAQATTNKQGSSGLVTDWPEDFPVRLDTDDGEFPKGAWVGSDFYSTPGDYLTAQEVAVHEDAQHIYEERLKFGVAREVARKDLPLSTYTEAYWKCDLKNLLHFLSLRMDSHAQKEIRDFANAIAEIVKVWVPNVWEAFDDYDFRRSGLLLSRQEVEGLKALLATRTSKPQLFWNDLLNAEQVEELREEVDRAMADPDYSMVTNFEVHFTRVPTDMTPDEAVEHLCDTAQLTEEQVATFRADVVKAQNDPNYRIVSQYPRRVGTGHFSSIDPDRSIQTALQASGLGKGREADELQAKLRNLLGV